MNSREEVDETDGSSDRHNLLTVDVKDGAAAPCCAPLNEKLVAVVLLDLNIVLRVINNTIFPLLIYTVEGKCVYMYKM